MRRLVESLSASWLLILIAGVAPSRAQEQSTVIAPPTPQDSDAGIRKFVSTYCFDCHDDVGRTADLSLETLCAASVGEHLDAWERVVRRLRARQMPPRDAQRPDEPAYEAVLASLERELDEAARKHPNAGRTDSLRRLSRAEYKNAVRDLLALDVDVESLLPADESGHGFDNVATAALSPTLMTRYIAAAQKISRLAMGGVEKSPSGYTVRLRPDLTQEEHVAGLPLGTRGGAVISYAFPRDGVYEIQVRLMRDRNEHVEGLARAHELEVLLDRERVASFTLQPPKDETAHATADAHLAARVKVAAGPHDVGVTFVKQPSALLETKRQPFDAHFNMHRHPRIGPAVYQVTITGPFEPQGPGETPSRRRILVCHPTSADDEDACARRIIAALARRAYRRPVTDDDLDKPLALFREAKKQAGFDAGIEAAVAAVLVSPNFLFRIERDPPDVVRGTTYRVSDLELASRLSFFLWSSIPDDELLELAERGELGSPVALRRQVRRMLADERSRSLVANFADQWLHLRNLDAMTPDARLFPDFDHNLRHAFRKETELLFESVVRENRSVLDLIDARHTFLNERLARHYGIPHIYGSHFRRVELDDASRRGGLLRQGSILTVTSYATRTSPVLRGHWVLKNLLGMAPPPPPPDVPDLPENAVAASLPMRERLAQHRADPACANCHDLMDPVGFALENYDAVGRWREFEHGRPVDAAGAFPDGSEFDGVEGLEKALLARPELFVDTMVERLLVFALGRGVESYDAPAIRQITREARDDWWRFSSLVVGIARSVPFQMRTSP
jgi:hypothetical protein